VEGSVGRKLIRHTPSHNSLKPGKHATNSNLARRPHRLIAAHPPRYSPTQPPHCLAWHILNADMIA